MKNNFKLIVLLLAVLILVDIVVIKIVQRPSGTLVSDKYKNLQTYRESELSPFNGTDPEKPIYIGMNGLVYDVSAGREFYQTNGSYHYLAGKDSSTELNLVGGGIIKRKYPVVGVLIK